MLSRELKIDWKWVQNHYLVSFAPTIFALSSNFILYQQRSPSERETKQFLIVKAHYLLSTMHVLFIRIIVRSFISPNRSCARIFQNPFGLSCLASILEYPRICLKLIHHLPLLHDACSHGDVFFSESLQYHAEHASIYVCGADPVLQSAHQHFRSQHLLVFLF